MKEQTASQYIAEQIAAGVLMGSQHYSVANVQQSYDKVHVHVVLLIYTNHCGALLDALMRLAQMGVTIDAMHRLSGKYEGSIEIDCLINPVQRKSKVPKAPHPLPFDDYVAHEDIEYVDQF